MNKHKKKHRGLDDHGPAHHRHHSGLGAGHHGKEKNIGHGSDEALDGRDQQRDGMEDEGLTCPMCNRNCSLSDPGCPKGAAYLRSLKSNHDKADVVAQQETAEHSQDLESLFKQTTRIMSRYNHRHDNPHHAQRHVYRMIKEKGPMPQKELMDILGIRSASLSEVLAKLERRGHICRRRNEEDKRGFIVEVNEEMEEEETLPGLQDMFSCLSAVETDQLAALLEKIISSADKGLDEGPRRRGNPGKAECHGRPEHQGRGGGKHGPGPKGKRLKKS